MRNSLSIINKLDDLEHVDVPYHEALSKFIDSDNAITSILKDMSSIDSSDEAILNMVEELTHIRASIEQFGISKSMMVMADSDSELPATGIVPDYESLPDVPSIGSDESLVVMTKLDEILVSSYEALAGTHAKVRESFESQVETLTTELTANSKALTDILKPLKSTNVDETKFKETIVNSYKSEDFGKMIGYGGVLAKIMTTSNINRVFNDISNSIRGFKGDSKQLNIALGKAGSSYAKAVAGLIDKPEVAEATGVQIKIGTNNSIGFKLVPIGFKTQKGTLGKLGWTSGVVKNTTKNFGRIIPSHLSFAQRVSKSISQMYKVNEAYLSYINKQEAKTQKLLIKPLMLQISVINMYRKMYISNLKNIQTIAKSLVILASATMKSKNK